jgi:hypothetical protein
MTCERERTCYTIIALPLARRPVTQNDPSQHNTKGNEALFLPIFILAINVVVVGRSYLVAVHPRFLLVPVHGFLPIAELPLIYGKH